MRVLGAMQVAAQTDASEVPFHRATSRTHPNFAVLNLFIILVLIGTGFKMSIDIVHLFHTIIFVRPRRACSWGNYSRPAGMTSPPLGRY